jgi:hypothetical protein
LDELTPYACLVQPVNHLIQRHGYIDNPASIHQVEVILRRVGDLGGELHESWSEFLGKVDIDWERQGINSYHTILLSEVPDQAALRGLLNRIWDLNLEIISLDKYSQGETDDN